MITLSPSAAQEIKRLQNACDQPNGKLRLTVESGGCATFYYELGLVEEPPEGDRTYNSEGIDIVVASQCDRLLQGMQIDYSQDLMGGGFRFHNPQATKTCSCGHSFDTE